jgi:hypothetical protein
MVTTYIIPIDTIKYYFIVISDRDHHEVGIIPCRIKWHRYGSSSVIVRNTNNSVVEDL